MTTTGRAGIGRQMMMTCAGALVVTLLLINPWYRLSWSYSDSLPARIVLIVFGEAPQRGDIVAMRWVGPPVAGHFENDIFLKRVAGVAGDRVSASGRAFFVNGAPVGVAKTHATSGFALETGPTGLIANGHYYLAGSSKDSFDSRYRIFGWIPDTQIVGKVYVLI